MTAGVAAAIPPFVLAAVPGAALPHATWNALVKGRARPGGPQGDPLPPMELLLGGTSTLGSYGIALWAMP